MAQPLNFWPLNPPSRMLNVDQSRHKPPVKPSPLSTSMEIAPHMMGLRSDVEFDAYMKANKAGPPVVMEFGSTWCQKCHEIFPTFFMLSKRYNQLKYAVAQVDYMRERAKGIKYSPTFNIYRSGKVVDQVLGKDPQKLEDHLWLHSDE